MKTSRLGVSNLFLAKVGQLEAKDWKWHEFWFVSSVAQSGICFFWMFKVPRTNLIYPSRKVKRQKFDSFNREVKMLTIKEVPFMLMFKKHWLVGVNPRSGVLLPVLFGRRGLKGCLMRLVYTTSAGSPASGLLSDWSKNKRSFGALHWLVKQHIWLPELLDRFRHLRLFMTETTRWSRNSFNSKLRF